ncbi:MAG: type IV pilus assembly protein PilM [Candidatus Saccharimonadia bacterium]
MRIPLVYKPEPVFGLDIGSHTVKLVQLKPGGNRPQVMGYGYAEFAVDSIIEGIISDPKPIAEAIKQVMKNPKGGSISARRVNLSVPVAKVFTRTLQLPPNMTVAELDQAVRLEAEQYVPVPSADLYIDYETITDPKGSPDHRDVLMVAAPRAIIDSYIKLFDFVDLQVESIETGLTSITRAMTAANPPQHRVIIVDFGTRSADLAIYEQGIRVTGSFSVGGDDLTQTLVKQLGITFDQANEIKYKFGIRKSGLQDKIMTALSPQLEHLTEETKKVIKYYMDRSEDQSSFDTLFMTGGSASMPGLVDYLYDRLKIPIIIGNPWLGLTYKHLPTLNRLEAPMYTTAIGLAQRGIKND